MNKVEDRIRAATQAQAQTLRQVRPLTLTPPPDPARRRLAPKWRWRWHGWLAPAAAAALVIAVAVALVAVRDAGDGRGLSPAARQADFAVPRYYVAVHQLGKSPLADGLVIGDTLTGARLATIAAARGSRFVGVTGAADDRTFVVSTMPVPHGVKPKLTVTWYLLRIQPGSTPDYRLTRLAIPDMRSWGVQGIALSPSGRELAMALFPANGGDRWVLRTYSVATGKLLRSWSTGNSVTLGVAVAIPGMQNLPLSWADGDRAVVFQTFGVSRESVLGRESERTIDVTTRSGNLIADSRVVWSTPDGTGAHGCELASPRLTADGKTVVCAATPVLGGKQGDRHVTLAWLAYSTSAPAVPRVLYKVTVGAPNTYGNLSGILWSSASGRTLIVEWAVARSISPSAEHFGVVSHGRFRRLPAIPSSLPGYPGAWTALAW